MSRRFTFCVKRGRVCQKADSFFLQMADLKENIENEVHSAHDQYLKLESHIKLYITEMDKCL